MNDSTSFTTSELATIVGGTLDGDGNVRVIGVADVGEAQPNEASFVTNPKYADKVASSRAGVLLVPVDFGRTPMPAIRCQGLERAVASLLGAFAPPVVKPASGIHPTASVHRTATIGPDSAIGPFVQIEADVRIGASVVIHAGCYIGRGTSLGDRCFLWPNVVVRDGCRIGNRVMIHSCSVIGADGFGYYFEEGRHHKVPHIGGVIIEDDVEIGACSCVDRAKFGFTVIGRGTKIDNQVQVAHNVRLGEGCLLAEPARVERGRKMHRLLTGRRRFPHTPR